MNSYNKTELNAIETAHYTVQIACFYYILFHTGQLWYFNNQVSAPGVKITTN